MSMTENEIFDNMLDLAMDNHEELLAYRAIGTVEEITKIINFLSCDDDTSVIDDMNLLIEYYKIGTVAEFKALKTENAHLHDEMQSINANMDLLEKEIRAKTIDEFVERLLNWKPKNEEYRSMRDVCNEIAQEMKNR